MGTTPKRHFVSRHPSWNPEILEIGTLATLEAHNFACKPPIEMKFEAKLYSLSRNFQWYVTRHLHARESRQFPTFNGWESNCQFDSQPFFWL